MQSFPRHLEQHENALITGAQKLTVLAAKERKVQEQARESSVALESALGNPAGVLVKHDKAAGAEPLLDDSCARGHLQTHSSEAAMGITATQQGRVQWLLEHVQKALAMGTIEQRTGDAGTACGG